MTSSSDSSRELKDDRERVATSTVVPHKKRTGIALCLSGGGFRAALFHLGGLRRLLELGILARIDTISAVSGGAIAAAALTRLDIASYDDPASKLEAFDKMVAVPLRSFAATDQRTGPLVWGWLRSYRRIGRASRISRADVHRPSGPITSLARRLEAITEGKLLSELPSRPRYKFLATDTRHLEAFAFERNSAGGVRSGYSAQASGDLPLSVAVAASAAFPPWFGELAFRERETALTSAVGSESGARAVSLVDGGLFDNLGIDTVWRDHRHLLVSDGGSLPEGDGNAISVFRRFKRYFDIADFAGRSSRKRWLLANLIESRFEGAYWSIRSQSSDYYLAQERDYDSVTVLRSIAGLRTDLNAFCFSERALLENHGYSVADAAIRTYCPELIELSQNTSPFRFPVAKLDPEVLKEAEGARRRSGVND